MAKGVTFHLSSIFQDNVCCLCLKKQLHESQEQNTKHQTHREKKNSEDQVSRHKQMHNRFTETLLPRHWIVLCHLQLFFKMDGFCGWWVFGFVLLGRGTEAWRRIAYSKSTCRVVDKPEILQVSWNATVGDFFSLIFPSFAQVCLQGKSVSLQRHHELHHTARVHSEV